jgi:hypothetical protein
MPTPFAAFLPLIAQGVSSAAQIFTNQQNKKTALQMYDMQRTDALADWNRQNQYNSPAAQMQRFKDAGLSPHLIYGQTNTAPPVRSSSVDTPKAQAPQIDPNAANVPFLALQLQAQEQNIKNMQAQEKLISAQTIKAKSETDWKNYNTGYMKAVEGWRMELLKNQGLLTESKYRTELQNTELTANKRNLLIAEIPRVRAQTQQILSQTKLNNEQKAQVTQLIENLKVTKELLGLKVDTQRFEAEAFQKIRAAGAVGSTLFQLLKLLK